MKKYKEVKEKIVGEYTICRKDTLVYKEDTNWGGEILYCNSCKKYIRD